MPEILLQSSPHILIARVCFLESLHCLSIFTVSFFLQVSCERAFSKLKIIKTRLRASLGNEKLKTFMLMSSEKDILDSVTVDDLIHVVTKDSQVFSKLLLL
jgi:hypothetical protein